MMENTDNSDCDRDGILSDVTIIPKDANDKEQLAPMVAQSMGH